MVYCNPYAWKKMMSVQSPCVGVCEMHEDFKICKGCYRSRLELIKWTKGTDEDREAILASVEIKRQTYGDINS